MTNSAWKKDPNVTLPVGLKWDGKIYREVVIDPMRGHDEENLPKAGENGSKAVTMILRRCILSIPGLIEAKKSTQDLLPPDYVRSMSTADRDYLFMRIRLLSSSHEFDCPFRCESCGEVHTRVVNLNELDLYEWPDDEPRHIDIELDEPVEIDGDMRDVIRWHFSNGKKEEAIASLGKAKVGSASLAANCEYMEKLSHEVVDYDKATFLRLDTDAASRLTTEVRSVIISTVSEELPGVDMNVDCICPSCSHEWEGQVSIDHFFRSSPQRAAKAKASQRKKRRKR